MNGAPSGGAQYYLGYSTTKSPIALTWAGTYRPLSQLTATAAALISLYSPLDSIDGVWEGFFTYTEFTAYAAMLGGASPQQIQNSIIGRHQQTWKLREWHRVRDDGVDVDVEVLDIGDPLRSFLPENLRMTETPEGLMARDPQSTVPVLYRKPGAKRGKVIDVIITGEGHSAWGQFSLTGRVRPCDGFISLSKDYVSFFKALSFCSAPTCYFSG